MSDHYDRYNGMDKLGTNLAEVGTDLISRAEAIEALHMDTSIIPFKKAREYADATISEIRNRLEKLPSAEPKRGKWISADAIFGGVPFYCSECGENTGDTVMGKPRWNFCPNCGAKMEVNHESN